MLRPTGWLLFVLLAALRGAAPAAAQQPEASGISLQPGDVIRVEVYREKELNGDFLVDETGVAILPLIGEQRVVGVPVRELRTRLMAEYRKELNNPSIIITPLRRINLLGQVQRPGMYPVDPTVSLAGAVALAGGTTLEGDLRRVRVIRAGRVIRNRVGVAETLSGADIRSGDQIVVDPKNWFSRNTSLVVSTILAVTSIATTIILTTRNQP